MLNDIFYIYVVFAIFFTVIFILAKCLYEFKKYDKYLYMSNETWLEYVLFHVVTYMLLGLIFGVDNFVLFLIKTVVVELGLAYVKNCSIENIPIESALYSIIIGIVSYIVGINIRNLYKK